ncbi:hypothetical protein JI435_012870, partial [Parastagonospora nodorum SN15]
CRCFVCPRGAHMLLYAHENKQYKVAWSSSLPSAVKLFIVCAHVTLSQSPTPVTFPTSHLARPPSAPNPQTSDISNIFPQTPNVIFDIPPSTSSKSHTNTYTHIMFGAPPQPSKRELEAAEAQTLTDIKWTAASVVVLYFSPHLVEYVSKLF